MNPQTSEHPVSGLKSDLVMCTARLTGAGAADLVNADSALLGGGEITAGVRTGAGKYTIAFRRKFPELKCAPLGTNVGTTDGIVMQWSAIDITAGTGSLEIYVGSTPTDLAATDTIHLLWIARDSGKNA